MTRDKRTLAVHAGTRRSQYSEMSEAIYMTQGFAYATAEAAEARFEQAGQDEFIYAQIRQPHCDACLRSGSPLWRAQRMGLPRPAVWRRSMGLWPR